MFVVILFRMCFVVFIRELKLTTCLRLHVIIPMGLDDPEQLIDRNPNAKVNKPVKKNLIY